MQPDPAATPEVAGDLARYPLPRLLFYLYKKQFLGRLDIATSDGGIARIHFRDGLPSGAQAPYLDDVLGQVLLDEGLISQEQHDASLQHLAQGGKLHGQILIEMGAIDRTQLIAGLRVQLQRRLNRMFHYHQESFALYAVDRQHDASTEAESQHVRADPLWVIHYGVRGAFDAARLATEMQNLRGREIRIPAKMAALLPRYGFDSQATALATTLLREAMPVEQAYQLSKLSRLDTDILLYTLWVTELLVLSDATSQRYPAVPSIGDGSTRKAAQSAPANSPNPPSPSPKSPTPRPPRRAGGYRLAGPQIALGNADAPPASAAAVASKPNPPAEAVQARPVTQSPSAVKPRGATTAPPAATKGEPAPRVNPSAEEMRKSLTERMKQIDDQNHFEVLGIDSKASLDLVREGYFKLAKQFHPDRIKGLGLDELVQQAEEILRRVNEAHRVLSDTKLRADYVRSLESPGDDGAEVRNVLAAEVAFQKGMVSLRKRDYPQAHTEFEEAYRLNPKEGEHLALVAWSRFHVSEADKKTLLPQLRDQLKKAIGISPRCVSAHYYMGEICLAMDDHKRAKASFTKTLDLQQNHVEAERRLRLMRMREQRDKEKPKGSLLNRFRKK